MVGLSLDHGFRWEMLKDSIVGFFQEGGFLIFHNYIWVFPVTPMFLDLPFNLKIERFKLTLKFRTRFFHSNRRFRKAPGPCALLAWWKETTGDACPALWACYNLLAVGGEKTEDDVESREKSQGIFGEMRFLYMCIYIFIDVCNIKQQKTYIYI